MHIFPAAKQPLATCAAECIPVPCSDEEQQCLHVHDNVIIPTCFDAGIQLLVRFMQWKHITVTRKHMVQISGSWDLHGMHCLQSL